MYLSPDATAAEIDAARPTYTNRDALETLVWARAHWIPEFRRDAIVRANREERNHRLRTGAERHECIDPGCTAEQEYLGRCLPCAKAYAD